MANPYLRRRTPLELHHDPSKKKESLPNDKIHDRIVVSQPPAMPSSDSTSFPNRSIPMGYTAWQLYVDRSKHEKEETKSHSKLYLLAGGSSSCIPPPLWTRLHGGIYELSGTGGSGKTQMALTLLQQAALRQQNSIYISLHGNTAIRKAQQRLQQMMSSHLDVSNANDTLKDPLQRISMLCCRNLDDFLEWLRDSPHGLSQNYRVIVVDSIADLFRIGEDNATASYVERSQHFYQIIQQLQRWVDERQRQPSGRTLSIVLINQVTTSLAGEDVPALGLSWSHCMHTRFFIERIDVAPEGGEGPRRLLTVKHSPRHAVQSASFRITPTEGCVYLPNEGRACNA